MARDPSKKGVRKIPPEFLKWIETYYGKRVATWYKTNVGKGKAEATRQRQYMSDLAGETGAVHEGHFRGAKDFDPDMGGGPTTGRTMRPQIGKYNVAHAEMPRISYRDMRDLGIPQDWVTDFYEAILESEGKGVIDGLDVQGAFEMDRGTSAEVASYNSRTRNDLRAQGEEIPGDRYKGTDKPAPITQLPEQQPLPPKFDTDSIKEGTGIPRVTGESRRAVPDLDISGGKVKFDTPSLNKTLGRFALGGSLAIAGSAMADKARAGDWGGVAWEGVAGVVGEVVPGLGDAVVTELENPAAAKSPTLDDAIAEQRNAQPHVPWEERLGNTISNEAEWAKNNPVEALKNVVGAGISSSIGSLVDNPMLAQFTAPYHAIKNIKGSIRVSNEEEEESPISVGFAEGGF